MTFHEAKSSLLFTKIPVSTYQNSTKVSNKLWKQKQSLPTSVQNCCLFLASCLKKTRFGWHHLQKIQAVLVCKTKKAYVWNHKFRLLHISSFCTIVITSAHSELNGLLKNMCMQTCSISKIYSSKTRWSCCICYFIIANFLNSVLITWHYHIISEGD